MGDDVRPKEQIGYWFSLLCAESQEVMTFCELPSGKEKAEFDGESSIEIIRVGNAKIRIMSDEKVVCAAANPRRWPGGVLRFFDADGVRHRLKVFTDADTATRAVDDWNDSPGLEEGGEEEEEDDD